MLICDFNLKFQCNFIEITHQHLLSLAANPANICVTVHHVPKCMSCHKAIVVITGRAHCFHDRIYVMYIIILGET